MSWYERMNRAMDYIESRLSGNMEFVEIARIMGQSAVNFQRTFSIVTGMSVFEYIRRRRMTLAAFDLQNGASKVIDLAIKYAYESPEAFTRAFKEIHGVSPTMARAQGVALRSFPRMTFLLTLKGDVAMEYRIENKEEFPVYGIEGIFTTEEGQNLVDIPAFWTDCFNDGCCEDLLQSTHDPLSRIHAICDYRETGGKTFPYMLFVHRTPASEVQGYTCVDVPAATWAVFKSERHTREQTSKVTQDLIKRVYTDWLPTASYRKIDGYELEMYHICGENDYYVEAWIKVEPN
ncbi:MAG: AraC family transcriptional regulator [Oscillospiraceae bacterium]|jgi:AraC family transcriptional regulator|nr:AraC family transcriptional regulator [Oscillospiraceae bacterium]